MVHAFAAFTQVPLAEPPGAAYQSVAAAGPAIQTNAINQAPSNANLRTSVCPESGLREDWGTHDDWDRMAVSRGDVKWNAGKSDDLAP